MTTQAPQAVTLEGEVVEQTSLVKHVDAIVMPAVNPKEALAAWNAYEDLKRQIGRPEDFQSQGGKDFPKKSLWRKMATFFNLTLEVVSEKEIKNEDGSIDFDVMYRALAPNGRSAIGDGSFNSYEKGFQQSRHNTRANAHTRAYNRAVSNLIGGGEVSYEEVESEDTRVVRAPHSSASSSTAEQRKAPSSLNWKDFRFKGGKFGPNGQENPNNPVGLSFDEILPEALKGYIDWMKSPKQAEKLKYNQAVIDLYDAWLKSKTSSVQESSLEEDQPPAFTDEDLPF